jgi:hypothetical protein
MLHAPALDSEKASDHISHRAHHVGIHNELCNESVISYLNSSQILVLPFTFDPSAFLGYFACHFFFLVPTSTQVTPAPKLPWTNHFLGFHSPTALLIPMFIPHLNSRIHSLHHITY